MTGTRGVHGVTKNQFHLRLAIQATSTILVMLPPLDRFEYKAAIGNVAEFLDIFRESTYLIKLKAKSMTHLHRC